jgi:hypothetical protein
MKCKLVKQKGRVPEAAKRKVKNDGLINVCWKEMGSFGIEASQVSEHETPPFSINIAIHHVSY